MVNNNQKGEFQFRDWTRLSNQTYQIFQDDKNPQQIMQPLDNLAYINNGIGLNKIEIVADCAAAPWAVIILFHWKGPLASSI